MPNKKLGLLSPVPALRTPDQVTRENGARIAAVECCRGLLTNRLDEEIILFTAESNIQSLQTELSYLDLVEVSVCPNTKIVPIGSITKVLKGEDLTALHTLNANELDKVAYVRDAFANRMFPVTCMQYGYTYQELLSFMAMHLLLAPTYQCDALVVTSEAAKEASMSILGRMKEELAGRFGARLQSDFQIKVVPHGIPVEIYKPRNRQEIRHQLELPLNKIIILYAGRLDPSSKSDLTPMLMAFQNLVAKYGDLVFFVLAGIIVSTDYKRQLDKAIGELGLTGNVLFRDSIPRGNVPLYYSAADIFVSLSETPQENFGLAPVEAMASGLPVIVSDWSAYKETTIHGVTGFKVPTLWVECDQDLCQLAPLYDWYVDHFYLSQSVAIDIEATTNYLDILVGNEELRRTMGEAARKHVVENFSSRRSSELMWSMWMELSELAAGMEHTQRKPSDFMRPHYFEDFKGLPSRLIDARAAVQITPRGRRVCAGKEQLLLLSDARGLIQEATLMKFLRLMRFINAAKIGTSIMELEARLSRKHRIDAITVRRHLMWLLKYDLIHLPYTDNSRKGD